MSASAVRQRRLAVANSAIGAAFAWPRFIATLAVGAAGGWLAWQADLPLAWMLGAMVATTGLTLAGVPLVMHGRLRAIMIAVIGVMLGSAFTPDLLSRAGEWAVSIGILAAFMSVSTFSLMLFLHKVAGYDPATAYFSAAPGGLVEMITVGSVMGGDDRIIALTHAVRLLIVVLAIPFFFRWLHGIGSGGPPGGGDPLLTMAGADIAVLVAAAVLGLPLGRLLRLPAYQFLGPLFLSAAAHLGGLTDSTPPPELVGVAQVVIGCGIGVRFAGVKLREMARPIAFAAASNLMMVLLAGVFALLALVIGSGQFGALLLAYSPGGLAEMSLIALAIQADVAFVSTHHIVRILLVVSLAPMAFMALRRMMMGRS
ncbi:MAG: AbrB family transcriptional regulator [Alphaproteobacteria bacterium]